MMLGLTEIIKLAVMNQTVGQKIEVIFVLLLAYTRWCFNELDYSLGEYEDLQGYESYNGGVK